MPMNRREFISYTVKGSSLLVTIPLAGAYEQKNSVRSKGGTDWCVYVQIKPDNQIIIESPVQDMGQHMKTTGPMIIAEELDADWSLVSCKPAKVYLKTKGEQAEYAYANMNTGGSHAVRNNWDYLRLAGAKIRALMLEAASTYWRVPIKQLSTQKSYVINSQSNEKLSYGTLAKVAVGLNLNDIAIQFKSPKDYQILGKQITTVDIEQIITGKPLYSIDMKLKDMLYAVILRAPFYHGVIDSFSDVETLKVSGVVRTIKIDLLLNEKNGRKIISEGIAVVAKSTWAAIKGREKLKVKWRQDKFSDESSEKLSTDFRMLCEGKEEGRVLVNDGHLENGFNASAKTYEMTFETQHLAHLCMEPFNAIVEVKKNAAKVVTGNQSPIGVAETVAKELSININNVEVIATRMGGGFGRRWQTDFVLETVKIAKHFNQPIKLTWTREDDVSQDHFGQAVYAKLKVGVDKKGNLIAWHNRQAQIAGSLREYCFPQGLIKKYKVESFNRAAGTNIGAWRGPGHIQNCFIAESMIDEVAFRQKKDPLEYRLALYGKERELAYKGYGAKSKNTERMKLCYRKVAEMSDWYAQRPEGVGLGIAGHFTFGSYAAFVVEYDSREKSKSKISRVWGAIDCGLALNPNHIKNQMEGGFIDGLNAALYNNVRINNGAVINTNFDTLHFMRIHESPQTIEIDILLNDYPATGVGEPPTAPAAAALANAIFAATGKRQTRLPLKLIEYSAKGRKNHVS